jgi:hypothetical protein
MKNEEIIDKLLQNYELANDALFKRGEGQSEGGDYNNAKVHGVLITKLKRHFPDHFCINSMGGYP